MPPAYVRLLGTGPRSAVICDTCGLHEIFEETGRTPQAPAASRAHNLAAHAYPEQTLDIPDTEEIAR